MKKIFSLPQQKNLRQSLRQQPITCERILWTKLRNKQLGGFKFKRQFGIDRFVVDFYCAERKLVIELDGATHSSNSEIEYDNLRQKFLEDNGLIVRRYENNDIKNNLDLVLEDILDGCRGFNS